MNSRFFVYFDVNKNKELVEGTDITLAYKAIFTLRKYLSFRNTLKK